MTYNKKEAGNHFKNDTASFLLQHTVGGYGILFMTPGTSAGPPVLGATQDLIQSKPIKFLNLRQTYGSFCNQNNF